MSCWSGMGGIGDRRWDEGRLSWLSGVILLGLLSFVESLGSEFFDDGFELRVVFHFSDETEPPGVRPRNDGFVGAVVAFGFAPLDETDVVSEA